MRFSSFLLFAVLLTAVHVAPALAGCEQDFEAGNVAFDDAYTLMESQKFEQAADRFGEAADLYSLASQSCTGENANNALANKDSAKALQTQALDFQFESLKPSAALQHPGALQAYDLMGEASLAYMAGDTEAYINLMLSAMSLYEEVLPDLEGEEREFVIKELESIAFSLSEVHG